MSDITFTQMQAAADGYLHALLWTESCRGTASHEHNTDDPQDCDASLSGVTDELSLSDAARAEIRQFVHDFIQENAEDFRAWRDAESRQGVSWSLAEDFGHNLLLSRNRHGGGFWDRGMGDLGDRLHQAAKCYGEITAYVGDDELIYVD